MPSLTAKCLISFVRPANIAAPTEVEQGVIRAFNEFFPEMQGDLFSFLQDHTCGCKQRLIDVLNRNPEQAEQLIAVIYKDLPVGRPIPEFAITQDDVADPTLLTSIAGTVVTIEPNIAEYRRVLRSMFAERKVYQGVFIKFDADAWQLFFY